MSGEVKLERHEGSPYQFRAVSPGHEKVQWVVLFALEKWPDSRAGGTLGHLSVYIDHGINVARVTVSACETHHELIPYVERIATSLVSSIVEDPDSWGAPSAQWEKRDREKWSRKKS